MKKVAKLLMIGPTGKYLLMYRSSHPRFGNDPDLPGGTLEDGETLLEAMLREVKEEAGVDVDASNVHEVYSGTDYSAHKTHYSLFISRFNNYPRIVMSWEHSSYEWLDKEEFLKQSKDSKDTYMRMVYDSIKNESP